MSAPVLRAYQREAIDAVIAARRSGVRRMVVCLPTGAGKTVIFSHLARLATKQVLVLAHREELLAQPVLCASVDAATSRSLRSLDHVVQGYPREAGAPLETETPL